MPIYIEARNVLNWPGGLAGGHMYLVYVPEGSEDDYSDWETIGAFPKIPSSPPGPWGLLDVTFLGSK